MANTPVVDSKIQEWDIHAKWDGNNAEFSISCNGKTFPLRWMQGYFVKPNSKTGNWSMADQEEITSMTWLAGFLRMIDEDVETNKYNQL